MEAVAGMVVVRQTEQVHQKLQQLLITMGLGGTGMGTPGGMGMGGF